MLGGTSPDRRVNKAVATWLSELRPPMRQKARDLGGKLSLRVRFRETSDVDYCITFEFSEPRRKQDGKLRILAAHFSG